MGATNVQKVANAVTAKNLLVGNRCCSCRYYGARFGYSHKAGKQEIDWCTLNNIRVPSGNTCNVWREVKQ